jgi:hypothetical protein
MAGITVRTMTMQTNLSPEEVVEGLNKIIDTNKRSRSEYRMAFHGKLDDEGFKVKQTFGDSFMKLKYVGAIEPKGSISPSRGYSASEVKIKAKMSIGYPLLLSGLWFFIYSFATWFFTFGLNDFGDAYYYMLPLHLLALLLPLYITTFPVAEDAKSAHIDFLKALDIRSGHKYEGINSAVTDATAATDTYL